MFDLIHGIPVHPLVVHAVVVLLPLACVGTIAIVVRPAWRERYGVLVVVAGALSVALIPVATSSGEALERRVGRPSEHAEMGDQLIWFAIPLFAFSLALVWLDRRHRAAIGPGGPGAVERNSRPTNVRVVAVLAVVAAVAASVQVYRVGDSGAKAAWGDRISSSSP